MERITILLGAEGVHPALIAVFVVAAALAGAFVIKFLDRLRKKDVETEAKAILDRAEREVENRRKEVDLQLKEKEIQQRAEGEKDLNEIRQELHERERKLDKRQDVLDQQTDQLRKQESMVENNQRKLAEQIANTRKRNEDLDQLIVDRATSCTTCRGSLGTRPRTSFCRP